VVRRQAKVARGGHQWLVVVEEEAGGVGGRFRGRRWGETVFLRCWAYL